MSDTTTKRRKHDWVLSGGGGGWEVWECRRCGRWAFPGVFGNLWPNQLGVFLRRFRCSGGEQ